MKKLLMILLAPVFLSACYMGPQGELVGVQPRKYWEQSNPYGMNYIHFGSYTMGPSDQDVPFALNTRSKTVTIPPFYMGQDMSRFASEHPCLPANMDSDGENKNCMFDG